MRHLASVGLTTREACGDTVRNVQGCHLAGACPHEVLDITPVGRGRVPALRAQPARAAAAAQVQDQLLRLRDRLRPGDVQRRRRDRRRRARSTTATVESGFRVFIAGGLGANPHPGAGARGVHAARRPAADHRGGAAGVRPDRQPRQQAAGPHEVARRHARLRRAAAPRARRCASMLPASSTWPGGIPDDRRASSATARPASHAAIAPTAIGQGTPVTLRAARPVRALGPGQRRARHRQAARVSAYAYAALGDITA